MQSSPVAPATTIHYIRHTKVAVFAAASEAFSMANINCSIQESLDRFRPVLERAKAATLPVRGYVSCVLGCPYDGRVRPGAVVEVSQWQGHLRFN